MTTTPPSRLDFWATFLLYMFGMFLIVIAADATINQKWGDILINYGILDEDSYYKKKFEKRQAAREKSSTQKSPGQNDPNSPEQGPLKTTTLIENLKDGGYTLFFRHAKRGNITSANSFDRMALLGTDPLPAPFEAGVCVTEAGRGEAALIGRIFDYHALPVGKIYSSPICRALETALYAFGRVDYTSAGLSLDGPLGDAEREQRNEAGRKIVLEPPAPGTNKIITAHGSILGRMIEFDKGLEQGSAAVIKHLEDGTVEVVGTLTVHDWASSVPVAFDLKPYQMPDAP